MDARAGAKVRAPQRAPGVGDPDVAARADAVRRTPAPGSYALACCSETASLIGACAARGLDGSATATDPTALR